MNINLAKNLKRLRKQREMTQENLADFIGVSFQAVSKWERGEGYPDITLLPVIANFFGVTLNSLVFNKANASRNTKANSSGELLEHIYHDGENVYKQHWNDKRMKHLIERLKMQAKDRHL